MKSLFLRKVGSSQWGTNIKLNLIKGYHLCMAVYLLPTKIVVKGQIIETKRRRATIFNCQKRKLRSKRQIDVFFLRKVQRRPLMFMR